VVAAGPCCCRGLAPSAAQLRTLLSCKPRGHLRRPHDVIALSPPCGLVAPMHPATLRYTHTHTHTHSHTHTHTAHRSETWDTFSYIAGQSHWNWASQQAVRLGGSLIMWRVGKGMPKKYGIDGGRWHGFGSCSCPGRSLGPVAEHTARPCGSSILFCVACSITAARAASRALPPPCMRANAGPRQPRAFCAAPRARRPSRCVVS
jgi:hypothetical protein